MKMMEQFLKIFNQEYMSPLDIKCGSAIYYEPNEIGFEEWLRKPLPIYYAYDKYSKFGECIEIYFHSITKNNRIPEDISDFFILKTKSQNEINNNKMIVNHFKTVDEYMRNQLFNDMEKSLKNFKMNVKTKIMDYKFEPEFWKDSLLTFEQIKQYKHKQRVHKLERLNRY